MMLLRVVQEDDVNFLYRLLKERDDTVNISHNSMPTIEEHTKFVLSNPYPYYRMICVKKKKIGVCYVTDSNEIGLFIAKKYQGQHFGARALEIIISGHPHVKLLANINPRNIKSMRLFTGYNFKLIQQTFALEPTSY